ncbi:unnamed protein product, partial [marine sediment metagenome]
GTEPMKWNLDTRSDGHDEEYLEGTEEEVMSDVMHHHDLDEWPAHWTLERADLLSPDQQQAGKFILFLTRMIHNAGG